jgi:hypothetical protein
MTSRTRLFYAALALISAFSGLWAEGKAQTAIPPSSQVRDVAPPPVGTGVIAGIVTTDDPTPQPVRRASVALAFGLRFPITTTTDDAGRFVFAGLAASNYTIVASKPGWVSAYYGAKTPGRGPGVPIALLDGQRVTGLALKMIHGGVITGVVRRPSGQPAIGLTVQALQAESVADTRRLAQAPMNVTTDDRGMYRVFGLAPGDYVIQVGSASLGFQPGEMRQVSAAEVRWADQIAAAPAGSPVANLGAPPAPGQSVAYAPVFYPGTPDVTAASAVTIGPGEERTGVDFTISMVPTARITGTVLGEDGQPFPNALINVLPIGSQADQLSIASIAASGLGTRPNAMGAFTVMNLTPGQYTLRVRASPRPANGGSSDPAAMLAAARQQMLGGNAQGAPVLWAEALVTVDGRDINDVVLRLQPGMTVSGKIVFDGTAAPPTDLTQMRIGLVPPPAGASAMQMISSMMLGGSQAKVAADGTFVVAGMTPGKYRANMGGPMALTTSMALTTGPWTLQSAMVNGHDIADLPLEIRPGEDVTGLVVTFTDRPTELSGSVIDAAGRAATGFPILVFSTDRTYWTLGSRRIQQAHPASDGKYVLSGLPPGEYFVCAVTDFTSNQLYEPAFLESIVPGAFKIALGDGEKKTQDLKLAGG